jgi:hypothetical protein
MRRSMMVAALAFGFAGLAAGASASGLESERLLAHVPFAFEAGGTTLPPGDYSLRQADDQNPAVLELRSRDSRYAMFLFVTDAGTESSTAVAPQLLFDRLGQKRFLRTVQLADGARELLPAPADELSAARAMASGSGATSRR